MKYREAKHLKVGDWITRRKDNLRLEIRTVEVFGQYHKVKFTAVLPTNAGGTLYCDGLTIVTLYNEDIL